MTNLIKKHYYLFFPLLITALMLCRGIYYYTIDDTFMVEIANSFKTNAHSEHLIFINVVVGYFLEFLYKLLPEVNWIAVLYLSVVNIAFVPMYRITQNYENKLLFVSILGLFQIVVFNFFSFTVMSFVCSACAILWCMEYVKKIDKNAIKHLLFVFILFYIGFSMRSGSTFKCVFLIFIPIYYFAFKEKRNSVWAIIAVLCLCTIANYGVSGVQKAYKKSLPDEMYFNQFHEYRSKLSDGGNLKFDIKKEFYESIGISENDLKLYREWDYADRNVFSNETMKKIYNKQTFNDKYTFNVFDFIKNRKEVVLVVGYVFISLLCFIFLKERRMEILFFTLFVLAGILYLFIRKRAPIRVLLPISLTAFITLTYMGMQQISNEFLHKKWLKNSLYIIVVFGVIAVNLYGMKNYNAHSSSHNKGETVIEFVESNKDKIYVSDDEMRRYVSPYILSLKSKENSLQQPYNIFGDWYVYSYFWYEQLDSLGLSEYKDSTFKALLGDKVRIIDDDTDLLDRISIFLDEHYDINAEYHLEEEIPGTRFKVYKFNRVN